MSRLLIIKGPNVGVTYELGEHTRIGRLGENEIQVPDPNVSRIHAEIIMERDLPVIYDRGSKNGVIVNGEAAGEHALKPGDEVTIGGSIFLFDGELAIHNARFSDNSIYYLSGADKKAGDAKPTSADENDGEINNSVRMLDEIAEIFAGKASPLPIVVERICERVRSYFKADHVVLFMKDSPNSEFRPFEAAPHGEAVCVDGDLLQEVATEKRALSVTLSLQGPRACELGGVDSSSVTDLPVAPKSKSANSDGPITSKKTKFKTIPLSIMVVPFGLDAEVKGLLLVSCHGDKKFPANSLSVLQSMSAFASLSVQAATALDNASRNIFQTAPNDEQRSASTRSLRMQEIYNSARRSADGEGTMLITGEMGTGKETLARFIHENSDRTDGPFVVVNCAAIPPDDFESVLFGYEKDADSEHKSTVAGKVEQAMGGTLYLAEVGELDLTLQPKLLRFLQDRAFYRIGSTHAVGADAKVIATTSVDLAAAVRSGKFREDLWYRLNVVPFHMPPLRERREDIGPLLDFFIARHTAHLNSRVLGANDSAVSLLQKYDWPGNIRELDNAVERAVLLAESKVLSTSDFGHIEEARRRLNSQADLERKRDTKPLAEVERQHIIIALKKHSFNQARAAEALGLHRNTLRNKIIEYGIEINK